MIVSHACNANHISIHALREEGDASGLQRRAAGSISIHALREEGDVPAQEHRRVGHQISIHALREEGDDLGGICADGVTKFLSTPSARRATRERKRQADRLQISIHALREEGDGYFAIVNLQYSISIHALREEGDLWQRTPPRCGTYFYPRPPRGGRPSIWKKLSESKGFLSTPSARRATVRREVG